MDHVKVLALRPITLGSTDLDSRCNILHAVSYIHNIYSDLLIKE